jgi:hypothetical protein
MVWKLTLRPAGDRTAVVDQILRQAAADARIVTISRDASNHYLYFCDSSEEAAEERQKYAKYRVISESLCALTITEKGMSANQAGEDDSQRRLAAFLEWIFQTFAPCGVYDGETGQDLSAVAQVNPSVLLR